MDRDRRGRSGRDRQRKGVVAAALVLASLFPAVAASAQPSPNNQCTLVPVLRDVTVNQGLGSFAPLVRRKQTLVRLYLSLPDRCNGSSITLSSATLTVKIDGRLPVDVSALAGAAGSQISPWDRLFTDQPGDPKFIVPASALRPATGNEGFTATFEATVVYTTSASSEPTTARFTTMSGTNSPITARFNRLSKSLRVLAVPMGDASQDPASQFTETTRRTLAAAMATLNRIYPVAAGVGALGDSAPGTVVPGIKYSITPTVLDVGPVAPTRWCGNGANFAEVKSGLSRLLSSHNAANPSAPADVVVGVIDGSLSKSGTEGCDEGRAAIDAPVAWIRAVAGTATAPSTGGALLGMEISHTTGLVPSNVSSSTSTTSTTSTTLPPRGFAYHSRNVAADGTSPDRAYNIVTRQFLADDHSVMKLQFPWHNNNTVFEAADWAYAVCKLTSQGPTNSECTTAGQVGGFGVHQPLFVLSGTTDGTKGGTHVGASYVSAGGGLPSEPVPASRYRLRQLDADGVVLRDEGVAVSAEDSQHGDRDGFEGPGLFTVAAEFASKTTRIELVNESGPGSVLLYAADRNLKPSGEDAPPGIIEVRSGGPPRNITVSDGVDDLRPALSPDGRLVAWVPATAASPGQPLQVARTDDLSVTVGVPGCGSECADPAWSADGRALAFVRNQESAAGTVHGLYTIAVDPSKAPGDPGFFPDGAARGVYVNSAPGWVVLSPTWSLGDATAPGTAIAFESKGPDPSTRRIRAVSLNSPATRIWEVSPAGVDARMPSWSHTPGDDRLAYVRVTPCGTGCESRSLHAIDPETGATTVLVDDPDGTQQVSWPSWGADDRIAFVRDGRVWITDSTEADPIRVTDGDGNGDQDDGPSLAGNRLAFQRWQPPGPLGPQRDLFLLDLGGPITVGSTAPPGSNPANPADLRLDLYLSCGTGTPDFPVAAAVTPDSVSGNTANFSVDWDPSLACGGPPAGPGLLSVGGPTLRAVVSDGFLRSAPSAPIAVDSDPKAPVATIVSPRAVAPDEQGPSPFLQHSSIPLSGSGRDVEDAELDGASLEWFLDGGPTPVATGSSAELPPQPPGRHTVVLRARDATGLTGEDQRSFEVLADADHDGVPGSVETCSSDANAADAFVDSDGDGLVNIDDYALTGQPCLPTNNLRVSADFDPDTFNPRASGGTVTITLGRAARPWTEVDPATVRLRLPGAPGCPPLDLPVVANGWKVAGSGVTAKFDRQALSAYLVGCRLQDQRVVVTVTGSSRSQPSPWRFTGYDGFNVS